MGESGCWWKKVKSGMCAWTDDSLLNPCLSHINHPCDSDVIFPSPIVALIPPPLTLSSRAL